MLFAEMKQGEIFGHPTHIFPQVMSPFTIKTNEKTRLRIIENPAVYLPSKDNVTCKDYLLEEFNSKYRFMK